MLSLDTETTGVDLYHAARPFFVSICKEDGSQLYWEWLIDPLTRMPEIPTEDILEICSYLEDEGEPETIIMQNGKFDVTALGTIGITGRAPSGWKWEHTFDTLIAAHLLASNRPKDLTSLALEYLGVDIEPYEKKLQEACVSARRIARSKFKDWKIAKEGLPGMPSAKKSGGKTEKTWKFDTWLPRRIALELVYPDDHPWWTVLSDYANMDTAVTVALWPVMRKEIERRGLWQIYLERMKVLPIAHQMESFGVSLGGNKWQEMYDRCVRESQESEAICTNIAASMGHEFKLPKSGSNLLMSDFCFTSPTGLRLPVIKRTEGGYPALDKYTLEDYENSLPPRSKSLAFVKHLRAKRKRDTAIAYMEGYRKFWLPWEPPYAERSPASNPTMSARYSHPGGDNQSPSEKPAGVVGRGIQGSDQTTTVDHQEKVRQTVLGVARSPAGRGLRRPASAGPETSPQGQLDTPLWPDTAGDACPAQVRQPQVRQTIPSVSGHQPGQRGRQDSQGPGEPTTGKRPHRRTVDGEGRSGDTLHIHQQQAPAGNSGCPSQEVQGVSSSGIGYYSQEDLDACGLASSGEVGAAAFDRWYVLHPNLNPTGTATLRWSSANPNSQNISKSEGFNLRDIFGPAPGREWWSCDAKNIELRIPAYEAREEAMIALFEQPDKPPYYGSNHLLVSHILHPKLFEACVNDRGEVDGRIFKKKYASTWYQWVKNGNFAVQYGAMESSGTADRAYHVPGGQHIVEGHFTRIKALNQWCITFAEKHGYIETIPDRTVDPKKGYPLLCTRTEWGKILPTVPLNYRVQGTAMWWTMKAMIRCHNKLKEWREEDGFTGFLCAQIHDEILFDFPKSQVEPSQETEQEKGCNLWRIRELVKLMESGGMDIGIPTPVSCEYHPVSWGEGISL